MIYKIYLTGIIFYIVFYSVLFLIYKVYLKVKFKEKIVFTEKDWYMIKLNFGISVLSWISFIIITLTTLKIILENKTNESEILNNE